MTIRSAVEELRRCQVHLPSGARMVVQEALNTLRLVDTVMTSEGGERIDAGAEEDAARFAAQVPAGWADVLASVPVALAACPTCSGTWWTPTTRVRIDAAEYVRSTSAGNQPAAQETRITVACSGCGYSPPG